MKDCKKCHTSIFRLSLSSTKSYELSLMQQFLSCIHGGRDVRGSPLGLCLCLAAVELMPVLQEWLEIGMLRSYVALLYALALVSIVPAMDQGRRGDSFLRRCAACSVIVKVLDAGM